MDFIKLSTLLLKAEKLKSCKEWQEFKQKWDNNIPKPSDKNYIEYKEEATRIQKIINNL